MPKQASKAGGRDRSSSLEFWAGETNYSQATHSTTAVPKAKPAMTAKMAYQLKWSQETVNTCPSSIGLTLSDQVDVDTVNLPANHLIEDGCINITSAGIYQVQLVLFLSNQTIMRPEI